MDVRIEPMTLSDLAEVLADHDEFWGGRDVRFLHQRVFVQEFADTCLTARGAGDRIAGYLLGFTTPRQVGYIHVVARSAAKRADPGAGRPCTGRSPPLRRGRERSG